MSSAALSPSSLPSTPRRRVFVLGATGTIGRATVRALLDRGHEVVAFVRPRAGIDGALTRQQSAELLDGADVRFGNATDRRSLQEEGFRGEHFDTLLSCMASRTGAPADAWAIDHDAHVAALDVAGRVGVTHMVLLSAICVQKPVLAFQQAKLAFEKRLMESGMAYSIVRPTAFFKSLSGQVGRVRNGKPFLVFGDGELTACKPISDANLGRYLAGCITDESRWNRILPIGGPGAAITPRAQGEYLFELLGKAPRFKHVPVTMLRGIVRTLSLAGRVLPAARRKADLARIGLYYATESMLVWDHERGRYDADATPSYGTETLFDHYARLIRGEERTELGDHAVF